MFERITNWVVSNYSPMVLWASVAGILLSVLCWSIVERLYAADAHKPKLAGYNILIMFLFLLVEPVMAFVAGAASNLAIRALAVPAIPLDLLAVTETSPAWLRPVIWIPLSLIPTILFDFLYYWMHYAQHKIPWLWEFHKLHHTDRALNVTTVHRDHWMEQLFAAIAISTPMAVVFDLSPVESGLVTLVTDQWSYFVHANLRVRLGWATLLVTGPQYHRIHHSIERKHHDKNLAAFLPIWDLLFGTCHRPAKDEWPQTGVEGETTTPSLTDAMFSPFITNGKAILRRLSARVGPANPPGQAPG